MSRQRKTFEHFSVWVDRRRSSEADARYDNSARHSPNDYGGVVLDLESLRSGRADCQDALSDGADALSRESASAVEEEQRGGNALLQDAPRDACWRSKGC